MERREIKRVAKAKVTARFGAVMGTWFALIGLILAMALLAVIVAVFALAAPTFAWAAREFSLIGFMVIGPALIALEVVLMVLLIYIPLSPMMVGYMRFCSNLQRGLPTTAGALFGEFRTGRRYVNALKMGICIWFRSFLWGLIPGAVGALSNFLPDELDGLLLLIQFVLILLVGAKTLPYMGGYVMIQDDETLGAWRATAASAELFRGRYGQLLAFYLSFLPWLLIGIPIVLLFVLLGLVGIPSFILPLLAWGAILVLAGFMTTYLVVSLFEWMSLLRGGAPAGYGATHSPNSAGAYYPGNAPYGYQPYSPYTGQGYPQQPAAPGYGQGYTQQPTAPGYGPGYVQQSATPGYEQGYAQQPAAPGYEQPASQQPQPPAAPRDAQTASAPTQAEKEKDAGTSPQTQLDVKELSEEQLGEQEAPRVL